MTTVDPFEKVESRRAQLIQESTEKEQALLQRIAAAKQKALELRGKADTESRNFHQQRANALRTEAATLEDTARTLTAVSLRNLKIEQENIRQHRHPELAALMTSANLKARNSQADQQRNAQKALVASRAAFEDHIAKLATKRTLELAQALADAATAAGGDCGSLVTALLATTRAA